MGQIFCVMGKSASGKDTIYKELLANKGLPLHRIVLYTTRPIRDGETAGETYHFCSEEQAMAWKEEGRIIEMRTYQTVYGPWRYFTADDGQIDLTEKNYLQIGTLENYVSMKCYFGEEHVVPIYVEVEDGERLMRAISREKQQKVPKYEEMCRRFLADAADFSEEKIADAGITKRFENHKLEDVIEEIAVYIRERIRG